MCHGLTLVLIETLRIHQSIFPTDQQNISLLTFVPREANHFITTTTTMANNPSHDAGSLQPRDLSLQFQALRIKLEGNPKEDNSDIPPLELPPPAIPIATPSIATPYNSVYPPRRTPGEPGTQKVADRPNVPKLSINTNVAAVSRRDINPWTSRSPITYMQDRPHLDWSSGMTPHSLELAPWLKGWRPGEMRWDPRWDDEFSNAGIGKQKKGQ
jgi:hypothetical protein